MFRPRHKYIIVLGSCCTVDAIRLKRHDDPDADSLRLLWYQGRTSLPSICTHGLREDEFELAGSDSVKPTDWGWMMVTDEISKRQHTRLLDVIGMSDALIVDLVSAFVFPYVVDRRSGRYFLKSKEWERYVVTRGPFEQQWLWDVPIERSVEAMRTLLDSLYTRQPALQVIFHLPRPCFNDGVTFDTPEIAVHVDYYQGYSQLLYREAVETFPRVAAISCGGEQADPAHINGPSPFHYTIRYTEGIRNDLARILRG